MKAIALLFALVSLPAFAVEWKSLFVSGDHSIPNFDNGRQDLSDLFSTFGAHRENQVHLSSSARVNEASGVATAGNILAGLQRLQVNPATDGCLVFMTSHGAKDQGFYLSRDGILAPARLAQYLNATCGDAPTVVLVSACYSGQFIAPGLVGPNRVILTAASKDRPSFGCSADTRYTYWDECLLEAVPNATTWKEVYKETSACISRKETAGGFKPSLPQAFFGQNVQDLAVLDR